MIGSPVAVTVGEFVALCNQTLEFAYPTVTITGELAHFSVRKNRWVYFDLKDELASVRFFGTVYQLPGPLEDGMTVAVTGSPRLHPQFGFSVNVQSIRPVGEGTIKKSADLLRTKLAAEGLFDESRKRSLPHPPTHIGLITSSESAAYHDFIKVVGERWGGVQITLADVQVQGESATEQIVQAINSFNQHPQAPDILVTTRGGGSAADLQAFSTEQVTRAIAGSRIPTLVAIGHEQDVCLAELAADRRASTPSNAAELLVPDRRAEHLRLQGYRDQLLAAALRSVHVAGSELRTARQTLGNGVAAVLAKETSRLVHRRQTLAAFDPDQALRRGYALVRKNDHHVRSGVQLQTGDVFLVEMRDAIITAKAQAVDNNKEDAK